MSNYAPQIPEQLAMEREDLPNGEQLSKLAEALAAYAGALSDAGALSGRLEGLDPGSERTRLRFEVLAKDSVARTALANVKILEASQEWSEGKLCDPDITGWNIPARTVTDAERQELPPL